MPVKLTQEYINSLKKNCSKCGKEFCVKLRKNRVIKGKLYDYWDIQGFKKYIFCGLVCANSSIGRQKKFSNRILETKIFHMESKTSELAYKNTVKYFRRKLNLKLSESNPDLVKARFAIELMKYKTKGRDTKCLS